MTSHRAVWHNVACPTCFAPKGLACEDDDGYRQPDKPQHPARVEAYEKEFH